MIPENFVISIFNMHLGAFWWVTTINSTNWSESTAVAWPGLLCGTWSISGCSVGACSWQKWLWFRFWFGFSFKKLTAVSVFRFGFCTVLFNLYDVLSCWTGPTNCQPKWLRTRRVEIWHKEKYFDCWSYHVGRWTVNETTWKTVPKQPKSVFWKPNCRNWVFEFEFWGQFGSVFRKPISDIFIEFRTPLLFCNLLPVAPRSVLYKL